MKILPPKSPVNFASRPDLDPDLGIFEGIFTTVGYGKIRHILLLTQEVVNRFLHIFEVVQRLLERLNA